MNESRTAALPKLLTRQGHARLAAEYDELFRVKRPIIVQRIADAAAEGDRSENAEYIYGRKKLRELDGRLRYLSKLMKDARLVDPDSLEGNRVVFGSTVVVEDEDGRRFTWQLVGEGEADPREGTISYRSPVGRALLDRRVGDEVEVELPAGEVCYEILELRFGIPASAPKLRTAERNPG